MAQKSGENHDNRNTAIVGVASVVVGAIIGCYICSCKGAAKGPPTCNYTGPQSIYIELESYKVSVDEAVGVAGWVTGYPDATEFAVNAPGGESAFGPPPVGTVVGNTTPTVHCEFGQGIELIYSAAGTYQIWVTDLAGAVKSNVVTLTVY